MLQLNSFADSRSWTPKILTDIVGRKKAQLEDRRDDNPLELLPEKPKRTPKKATESSDKNSTDTGNERSSILSNAVHFLIDDLKLLNYSDKNSTSDEQVKSSSRNALDRAINDLFIDQNNNEIIEEDR